MLFHSTGWIGSRLCEMAQPTIPAANNGSAGGCCRILGRTIHQASAATRAIGETTTAAGTSAQLGRVPEASLQQLRWLESRLKRPGTCRLAFWHTPRFSAGRHGDDSSLNPFWRAFRGAPRSSSTHTITTISVLPPRRDHPVHRRDRRARPLRRRRGGSSAGVIERRRLRSPAARASAWSRELRVSDHRPESAWTAGRLRAIQLLAARTGRRPHS